MCILEKKLQHFPKRKGDTMQRLKDIVDEKLKKERLQDEEKKRLEKELSVIEETGVVPVILFFYDTVYAFKGDVWVHGNAHCSFLLYFLGLTKVNPFHYGLPFERYFDKNRNNLPVVAFAVTKGKKGEVMRYLKEWYGVDKIARVKDMENEYILSAKSMFCFDEIEETLLHVHQPQSAIWHEDISAMTMQDVGKNNLYTIRIQEAEIGAYYPFSETEIYKKTLEVFDNEWRNFNAQPRYCGIVGVEEILKRTDGRLVYQEQFFEICRTMLGVSDSVAEEFRRCIIKCDKKSKEEIRALFYGTLGAEGERLFQYISQYFAYAVCKAYAIGLLFLKFSQ